MASESNYDMLCSSYDCDSNDFSLDTNRNIAQFQLHIEGEFVQLVLYLMFYCALTRGSVKPLSFGVS